MTRTNSAEPATNACPSCHRSFPTRQGLRIHHTKVHQDPLPNRTCVDCGGRFYDPKARRKFCSDCNPNAGKNNGNWSGAKETTICRTCDAEFEYYPSDKKGVYCSACVESSDGLLPEPFPKPFDRVVTDCRQCGADIRVLPSQIEQQQRGFFCDLECYGRWLSENIVGRDHHQWQGGGINYGKNWWRVRRRALDRDDHRCQHCGSTAAELGREPDVHHITPVREFDRPEDAHMLENVVTLCRSCHRHVEEGNIHLPGLRSRR